MTVRALREPLKVYRIGDPAGRFPVYNGDGAALFPGRWNEHRQPVIYAGEHYSTALLEILAHASGVLPPNQHFIEIQIPQHTSYEEVTKDSLPNWHADDAAESRSFGGRWLREQRTAILIVPSYVAREEVNVLINPAHAQSPSIKVSRERPVMWDRRLFTRQTLVRAPKV
jgi:RES domain-containing protein